MNAVALAAGIGGSLVTGSAALWASFSPTNTFWGPVHARGPADGRPRYALTFDDGPTPESTPAILDMLGELNARAAFFVIGANVRRCPQLLSRMHREGHVVANHSFDHPRMGIFRGPWYWERQVRQTDAIIQQVIGKRAMMFRPPMGIKTWYVMGAALRAGHAVINWTRRGVDGIATTPERILARLVPSAQAGDVLLLHDGVEPRSKRDPSATVAAIRPLILRLRDRGLEPAALDQFLGLPAYAEAHSAAQVA